MWSHVLDEHGNMVIQWSGKGVQFLPTISEGNLLCLWRPQKSLLLRLLVTDIDVGVCKLASKFYVSIVCVHNIIYIYML